MGLGKLDEKGRMPLEHKVLSLPQEGQSRFRTTTGASQLEAGPLRDVPTDEPGEPPL